MRISSRAVIIKDGKVLTIFRRKVKDGKVKEYYVLPGGGQEQGEALTDTVLRELNEELGVKVRVLGYLGGDDIGNNYYHCEIVEGYPQLGGEELDRMSDENYYQPVYVELNELEKIDLFGKDFIKKACDDEYVLDDNL